MNVWTRISAWATVTTFLPNMIDMSFNKSDDQKLFVHAIGNSLIVGLFYPVMIPTIAKEMYSHIQGQHSNNYPGGNGWYVFDKYYRIASFSKNTGNTPDLPPSLDELKKIWLE